MVTTKEEERKYLEDEAHVSMDEKRLINWVGKLAAKGKELVKNMKIEESYKVLKEIEKVLPTLVQEVKREVQDEREEEKIQREEKKATRLEKDVVWYLNKELKYFEKLYDIAKNLDNFAKKADLKDPRLLKVASNYLKQLKTYERREQFRARVSQLKGAIEKFLISAGLNETARRKIEPLVEKMRVFEADLLEKTVKELEKKLRVSIPSQISTKKEQKIWLQWLQGLQGITSRLKQDLQALVDLDEELLKIFKEIKKALKV